jgi:hypothetical protein
MGVLMSDEIKRGLQYPLRRKLLMGMAALPAISMLPRPSFAAMDENTALVSIQNWRSTPVYKGAEILRRNTAGGAVAMANAPDNSDEFAAVHLLVNTWEAIATLLDEVENKDRIFEITPICHMHNNLKDAIPVLSLRHTNLISAADFVIPNGGYGARFSKLANDYDNWLIEKQKSAQYITGACSGLHAYFG